MHPLVLSSLRTHPWGRTSANREKVVLPGCPYNAHIIFEKLRTARGLADLLTAVETSCLGPSPTTVLLCVDRGTNRYCQWFDKMQLYHLAHQLLVLYICIYICNKSSNTAQAFLIPLNYRRNFKFV